MITHYPHFKEQLSFSGKIIVQPKAMQEVGTESFLITQKLKVKGQKLGELDRWTFCKMREDCFHREKLPRNER